MSFVAEIVPFRALRYDEGKAGPLADLICPPYDVIADDERGDLYGKDPRNFVRVEYGKGDVADDARSNRYTRAKDLAESWIREGVLRADAVPAFYVYEHGFGLDGQRLRCRGFFAALRLYRPEESMVLPHELTIPKDKTDRLELVRRTRLNTSPVFGLFDDASGVVARIVERSIARTPLAEANAGAETHRVWSVHDAGDLWALRDALSHTRVYLADGHHRYEVALEYLQEEIKAGRVEAPNAAERYVLTYLCALDDQGLRILPTHRIVWGARSAVDAAIARSFDPAPIDRGAVADTEPGIVLVRDGTFTRLEPRADADLSGISDLWRSLPVAEAETLLIQPARNSGGQVRYEHDTQRAINAARRGADAILIRAVDALTLQKVADSGERMPPKTTYFYPKVPAGLVIRSLDLG